MLKRRSFVLLLSFLLCLFMSACSAAAADHGSNASSGTVTTASDTEAAVSDTGVTTAPGAEVTFEEAHIPDSEWQLDVSFPDWRGDISSTYPINNCVGFYGYSGQGQIYLACDESVSEFELFLNGRKVNTQAVSSGKSYTADISPVTVNGMNTIQVSGLEDGTVRVCIPYPVIIPGTPEEAGIDEKAFDLIDRIISADIENGFPGAQLAVIKDGRLVYEKAWGNVTTYDEKGASKIGAPVTVDTLYDLASNTKMYSVNYALQYLLTKGEVDLDSRVADIMGNSFADDTIKIDYEGYDPVSPETNKKWKEELTLRDLLRHQGGFPPGPHYYNDRYDHASQDFDSDKGNVIYVGTAGDEQAREDTWEALCRTPLMYEPGSDTVYSDADYMILCYCIEKITGKRLDDYLSEVFFDPMALSHITYNPLKNGFTAKDCAATELMGNTRDGRLHYSGIRENTIQGEVHDANAYYCMAGISGHAGLFSNAADLAKLASVMLTGGYGDKKYFSRDVIDLFTAPKSESYPGYGLGWWREAEHRRDWYFGSVTDPDAFGHQGFTGTLSVIDPENNLVVVLLTNKLHTPMVENDETLGKWYGDFYTTASLGFATQIIKMGMAEEIDESVWRALTADMAADAKRQLDQEGITDENHPRMKAYKALLSVLDGLLHGRPYEERSFPIALSREM